MARIKIQMSIRIDEEQIKEVSDEDLIEWVLFEFGKPVSKEPVNVLETLSRISPERSKQAFGLEVADWSLTDWACALSGEVGELCNFVKKQRRDGEDRTRDIAKEAADVAIYLDLFCTRARINLQQAIIAKFNDTSDKMGCAIKIPEE